MNDQYTKKRCTDVLLRVWQNRLQIVGANAVTDSAVDWKEALHADPVGRTHCPQGAESAVDYLGGYAADSRQNGIHLFFSYSGFSLLRRLVSLPGTWKLACPSIERMRLIRRPRVVKHTWETRELMGCLYASNVVTDDLRWPNEGQVTKFWIIMISRTVLSYHYTTKLDWSDISIW